MMDSKKRRRLSENLCRPKRMPTTNAHMLAAAAAAQEINIHVWPNVNAEMGRRILVIFVCLLLSDAASMMFTQHQTSHPLLPLLPFNLISSITKI